MFHHCGPERGHNFFTPRNAQPGNQETSGNRNASWIFSVESYRIRRYGRNKKPGIKPGFFDVSAKNDQKLARTPSMYCEVTSPASTSPTTPQVSLMMNCAPRVPLNSPW
jgi:hypothetical protein